MRGDQVDLGHNRLVTGGELAPLELGQGVLVGHRGVAEGRAVVADVEPVVKLVVVVEPRARRPGVIVSGVVADSAPAALVEGVAEGEPAAGDELGIPLLAVNPQPRLQGGVRELADPAEAGGGDPGALRGPAGAGQRGGALAQECVDARGEAGALDGDLPVAFDEGDDDVLAAQSGEQVRSGDTGLGIGAADEPREMTLVADRSLGGAHLRDGQPDSAGRGDRESRDELQRQARAQPTDRSDGSEAASCDAAMPGGHGRDVDR